MTRSAALQHGLAHPWTSFMAERQTFGRPIVSNFPFGRGPWTEQTG
uniref:Uncharacterized protein n=1 Tax=Arundo donax TaxID=35708 RepID=A0A0A9ANQ0_ARUDO